MHDYSTYFFSLQTLERRKNDKYKLLSRASLPLFRSRKFFYFGFLSNIKKFLLLISPVRQTIWYYFILLNWLF